MTGPSEFERENVIVTGAGRGIGASIADRFLRLGANVVAVERDPLLVKKMKETFSGDLDRLYIVAGDASEEKTAAKAVREMVKRFGTPGVLINNVGRSYRGPLDEMALRDWNGVLKTNLTSAFLFARAVIPFFKEQRRGCIVNISSISGLRGNPERVAYNATKFGLIGFTKGLAMELGPYQVRANAVCPGDVDTEMLRSWMDWSSGQEKRPVEEVSARIRSEIPLGRIASPEDIAEVVLFLASSASRYITGAAVPVTGGKYGI